MNTCLQHRNAGRGAIAFFLILLVTLSGATNSGAQPPAVGVVSGIVIDAATKKPLSGVTLQLARRARGAVTRSDGRFRIIALPVGRHSLIVSSIGYASRQIEFDIASNDTTRLTIALTEQLLQTDEVVVSAGKRIQAVQDVPVSIATVDQRSLEQRNITRLDDALRYIPGLYVSRDQVNVRGSSGFSLGLGSRVLVLIDGFPLLAGDTGEIKFDALPIFNLQRIEVVKGAGSALYGSSALGGVINAITADPSPESEVRLRAYSGVYTLPREEWQYRSTLPFTGGADLSYSQRFGRLGLLAAGGVKRTEGHHDYLKTLRWNGFVKSSYDLSDATQISAFANVARQTRDNFVFWKDLRNATRPPDGTNRDEEIVSDKLAVAATLRHIFSNELFATLRGGLYRTEFEETTTSADDDQLSSSADAWNTELQVNTILSENWLLTAGASGQLNTIAESFLGDQEQVILAGYAQAEWKPADKITLTGGARLDHENTTSLASHTQLSPKAGMSWEVFDSTRLRTSLGFGFRTPTLGERFAELRFGNLRVAPNPTLAPEKSWSAEIGLNQDIALAEGAWNVDAAFFYNRFNDLIEPILPSDGDGNIRFINITRAQIFGVELGVKGWLPGNVAGLELALTAMQPDDLDSDTDLKYRSKLLFQTRLILPLGPLQFQTDYRFQDRFDHIDDEVRFAIRDHDARVDVHVVDMRLIADMYKAAGLPLRLTLNADNVFNYYYTEIIGNLAPTRSLTLQLATQLP